jgi:hypothetical protein
MAGTRQRWSWKLLQQELLSTPTQLKENEGVTEFCEQRNANEHEQKHNSLPKTPPKTSQKRTSCVEWESMATYEVSITMDFYVASFDLEFVPAFVQSKSVPLVLL